MPNRSRSRPAPSRARGARVPWARWSNERLLDLRLRDLGLAIEGTWLEDCVAELYGELASRGIALRPHVWLSHEWFSPAGVPGIAVPFYLAHPRLMRLERSQMLEVEGGTREECLRILRHECGHAIQHAYLVHRRRRWRELFGRSSQPYPDLYRPNPASRRFVQHLRLFYAQSHPDEDFAETFAVWLQPRHLWRRRYAGWHWRSSSTWTNSWRSWPGRRRGCARGCELSRWRVAGARCSSTTPRNASATR
jgi:hypothetical protein